jgi:type II secretory ATPase GspE/PulE/Tfp pilus assembly ATPase PilB-like protein
MMLGRIADPQVIKAVLNSAGEMRCYGGMHQDDTFAALGAWVKLSGDPRLAVANLSAIVAQRLVRKLCPTSRIAFKPDPAALKKLNVAPDRVDKFYKQSGQVMVKNKPEPCPTCRGLGYQGRTGVFEVLVLDDTGRKLVVAGQLDQFRGHVRKQKMLWMQEAGVAKVVDGITSIVEVTRVLGEKTKGRA